MTDNTTEFLALLIVLALSCATLAGLIALLGWLRRRATPLPPEAQVEQALQPYVFAGICAAYRVGEWAMDRVGRRLRGADKQAIATAVYRLLPERIGDLDLSVVKRLVPPARFARLVQDTFDRFDAQFIQAQGRYQELFEQWMADWQSQPEGRTASQPANLPPSQPANPAAREARP